VLAIAVSLLITFYLIIPETIFRSVFGSFVPTRSFVLTGAETVKRAVVVALLPFILALATCWYVPGPRNWPFGIEQNSVHARRSDYKIVTAAFYSDTEFAKSQVEFWPALTRSLRRQARLVSWYFVLVTVEAFLAGKLASDYAKFKDNRFYKWLSDKILFRYISEWHPLLTPYLLPETNVQADLLCTNNTLYQGEVSQHFLKDGQLTGIILTDPRRFDRERYLTDKALTEKNGGPKPDKEKYWVKIPSRNLYFFADKIFNMNLTYVTGAATPIDATAVENFVESALGSKLKDLSNLKVTIQSKDIAAPETKIKKEK